MLSYLLVLLFSQSSEATLRVDIPRGESTAKFEVAGRGPELCFVPKHFSGADYSKKDADREAKLCDFNIGVNVAACPKDYSTNPGIDFYQAPEGVSIDELTAKNCEILNDKKKNTAKKEAKYKLSTSCSYTPAILAYYHFSRLLGDIVNVPTAVLRTMDLERHLALGNKALALTKPKPGKAVSLIYQTWQGIVSALTQGTRGKKPDLLFTDRYDQSYGALSRNPRGEEIYKEFFNGGTDRIAAFKTKNPIYRALTTPTLSVGREFNQANVQAMLQLRDASDWILLDTVLGQQDRMGNIHDEPKYFYLKDKDGAVDLKSKDKKEEVPAELLPTAVIAKEMILKDNDCGVAKENRIKDAHLLDKVAHMNPKTYKRLLALEALMDGPDMKAQLSDELMFTEDDFRKVRANLKDSVDLLKGACQSGRLKLDLDLNLFFSKQPLPTQYDCN